MHNNYYNHYIPNRGPKSPESMGPRSPGIKLLLEKIRFYFRKFAIFVGVQQFLSEYCHKIRTRNFPRQDN